jgi:hypothetical protein
MFGPDTSWLAIRSNDREAVCSALGVGDRSELPLDRGVARAHQRGVCVIGPLAEVWTLVVAPATQLGELEPLAARAAAALGEAQAFVCLDRLRRFGWLAADDQGVRRAFEWSRGSIVSDVGDRRRGEPAALERVEESTVLEVAGSWSLDPSAAARADPPATALVAELAGFEPRWDVKAIGRKLLIGFGGGVAALLVAIQLGRLFALTSAWPAGAVAGFLLFLGGRQLPPRWRALAMFAGITLGCGAVLGGMFADAP